MTKGEEAELNQRLRRVLKARALLEQVEYPDGGEDWSLLANATTALDMLVERAGRETATPPRDG